jgi:hypothetical protein
MPLPRVERFLLILALCCCLVSAWQIALYVADNSFVDGLCAALGTSDLGPEARALRLFHWVSTYDAPDSTNSQTTVSLDPPSGLLTPRAMVANRAYFRANCGSKAWLLAIMARSAGLDARELRLCDARHQARHVICEIHVGGRWVVFDPTAHLEFRRADGRLATATELRNPVLLAANAARVSGYDLRRWRFDHAERLHYEKAPLIGGLLRRLAPRVTGRPAEELAAPAVLERPRLAVVASLIGLTLLSLVTAGALTRRRIWAAARRAGQPHPRLRGLALEAEQD